MRSSFQMRLAAWALCGLLPFAILAGEPDDGGDDVPKPKSAAAAPKKEPKLGPGSAMDHGPFVCASISDVLVSNTGEWPNSKDPGNFAYKGMALRLGNDVYACFDLDLMRYAMVWSGEYLKLPNTMLNDVRGTVSPIPAGPISIATKMIPGWSPDGTFKDPRPNPYGPLPKDVSHYSGCYLNGNNVVLKYTVGGTEILEMPGALGSGANAVFTRTIHIAKSAGPLSILLANGEGGAQLKGAPEGSAIKNENGTLSVTLPAITKPVTFKIAQWAGATANAGAAASLEKIEDIAALTKGGSLRWGAPITTQGVMGKDDGPYTVDTLTLPEQNPWKAWMRCSGFDFFSDGRAAISTLDGDVWIVSGLEKDLGTLQWKRYATGMYELLGLKIADDVIYVCGRDQITRLHDLNTDGEADFYENFNNDRITSPNYHAFAFGLERDAAGNFYYAVCGHRAKPTLPQQGCMMRVSKDGSKLDVFAGGLRSPNGLGMGPNDTLTYGDNQGNFIPASKVTRVKEGGFYGYLPHHQQATKPTDYERPIFWLPMNMDNSCGGQAWVPDDRWGPYKGQMVHLSYGKGEGFLCFIEDIGGTWQGGAQKLPFKFASGSMRARFNPKDGQLYLCGLKGWQTAGNRDGCFQRVRYTGKTPNYPTALNVKPTGIEIHYPVKLDPESANDPLSFSIEQWNYNYSPAYGSPEFTVKDPKAKGRDPVVVKSAKLSADGKCVFLEIPGIAPVMQMRIQYRIKAADETNITHDLYHTIHRIQ